jgi:dTDP-4-dehydrorhamnose reductase
LKLLIFGKTGQVARALARRIPIGVKATFLDRGEADLSNPLACAQVIDGASFDAVINAAAWTAVDEAEAKEDMATLVNGEAPTAMANVCAAKGIPILHISTDYVFDGSGNEPFSPKDETAPLGAYGRSKLVGEKGIQASGAQYLILRTSWVFSAHGTNFAKTMLRLGAERDVLRVVADQFGGPTPADAIADALIAAARSMVDGHTEGIYHFSGSPDTSWAEFARTIMKAAKLPCRVEDIPTSQYPTRAKRPLNSRFQCTSFEQDFGVPRPDWRVGLDEIMSELGVIT